MSVVGAGGGVSVGASGGGVSVGGAGGGRSDGGKDDGGGRSEGEALAGVGRVIEGGMSDGGFGRTTERGDGIEDSTSVEACSFRGRFPRISADATSFGSAYSRRFRGFLACAQPLDDGVTEDDGRADMDLLKKP